jgi:hypothetical protein
MIYVRNIISPRLFISAFTWISRWHSHGYHVGIHMTAGFMTKSLKSYRGIIKVHFFFLCREITFHDLGSGAIQTIFIMEYRSPPVSSRRQNKCPFCHECHSPIPNAREPEGSETPHPTPVDRHLTCAWSWLFSCEHQPSGHGPQRHAWRGELSTQPGGSKS